MDNIYVYFVHLPSGINEIVVPCADGVTIYIEITLDRKKRIEAYKHAMGHVQNDDFQKSNVQDIEFQAHKINN